MIQRIQTLYLLLSIVLLSLLYAFPFLIFDGNSGDISFSMFGSQMQRADGSAIANDADLIPIILSATAAFFAFIAIFLFKKRNIQLIFSYIAVLTVLVLLGWFIFTLVSVPGSPLFAEFAPRFNAIKSWGLFFPVLALLSLFLAIKNIRKDEQLVRSLDRIR